MYKEEGKAFPYAAIGDANTPLPLLPAALPTG